MSAFDRLQNYSAREKTTTSDVFDTNTPSGCFLSKVHNEGYNMYTYSYVNTETSEAITEETYNFLSEEEKSCFEKKLNYTELYDAITTEGNQVINSVAGSGKTSTLIFKIIYDIITGSAVVLKGIPGGSTVRVVDKMWVCTFLRTGAEELDSALRRWQRGLGYSQTSDQITFSTLDAEFKRCLNAMGVETNIGKSEKLFSLMKKAIDSCNITRGGSSLTREDYQIISGIITYFRGRLDSKRYQHPSCADYDITPTILDLIVKQFASLRQAEGIMDFDEIQELLYKYLYVTPNPSVQEFVANRYNYIYIDEFQDTSQMQYAILKFYARGKLWMNVSGDKPSDNDVLFTGQETKGKIVAIGDVSQCIYSFKGSDSKILAELFDKDFRPSISKLSINWRCPSNILEPVVPSIHKNWDSAFQTIKSSKQGGEFFAYSFTSYKAMCSQLIKDIKKDIDDDMSVAILCRTNYDGMIPAFMLEANTETKFNFSISSDNMTMNSALPRKIIGVTSLFTERSTQSVQSSLEMFIKFGGDGKYQIKSLMNICKMNNTSIFNLPMEDISYSAPEIAPFIKELRNIIIVDGKRDREKEVEALKYVYSYMIVNTFGGKSAYCESARAYIETLLYILDNNDFKSVYEFIEEISFLNDKLNGRIKLKKANIQIATVHEFKGKECDSVYIWNDSEGVFPSSKCDLNDEDQLNEERRVHYIACTRAKKREHIYTLAGKIGMFVNEMDCKLENPVGISVSL